MKKILILLFLLLSYGWSCERGEITDYDLIDIDWILSSIEDIGTGETSDFPADAAREISIFFDGDSNAMYFTGICNFEVGIYEFTSSHGEITISGMVTAESGCEYIEWEAIAMRNLQNNTGYIINGNSLIVYSDDSHNLNFIKN